MLPIELHHKFSDYTIWFVVAPGGIEPLDHDALDSE